jgi:hypothetical protein
MGPTTAVGAMIEGQNPFVAARDQDFQSTVVGYDEAGNPIDGVQWSESDTYQALVDKGVHPLLAFAADFLLVPDPTGVSPGRVTDLVPLLGLIGPGGLRAMMQYGKDVQFVPASLLNDMAGNEIRRTPDEMAEFRRTLANDPGGINDPAVIIYDPNSMRMYTGEGNHRTRAALEEDSPVPVRVVMGKVHEGRGLPIPPEAQAALLDLAERHHGYQPSRMTAGQLGLPVYDDQSIIEYAARHAEDLAAPLSDADLEEMADMLSAIQARLLTEPTPQVGPVISRDPTPVRDYTESIRRFSGNQTPEEYVDELVELMGWERAMPYLMRQTGLSEDELAVTLQLWGDNYGETVRALPYEASAVDRPIRPGELENLMSEGGVLARSDDMPLDNSVGGDPRMSEVADAELQNLVTEGERVAAETEANAAGMAELGRPVDPVAEWQNLQGFLNDIEEAFRNADTTDEIAATLDQLAADLEFQNLRSVDRARYEYQLELARERLAQFAPQPPRAEMGIDARVKRILDELDAGNLTPESRADSDAVIAEIHKELDEIVSSPSFSDRSTDVDERLILLNEYLSAMRRIDPLGGNP